MKGRGVYKSAPACWLRWVGQLRRRAVANKRKFARNKLQQTCHARSGGGIPHHTRQRKRNVAHEKKRHPRERTRKRASKTGTTPSPAQRYTTRTHTHTRTHTQTGATTSKHQRWESNTSSRVAMPRLVITTTKSKQGTPQEGKTTGTPKARPCAADEGCRRQGVG